MRCGSTTAAPSGVATEADLRRAVAIARQKGCAVAIGLIHPGSRVIGPVTHLPFVNADELAARHWPEAPDLHAYEASQLATSLPGCPPGSPPGPGDPNGTARPGSPHGCYRKTGVDTGALPELRSVPVTFQLGSPVERGMTRRPDSVGWSSTTTVLPAGTSKRPCATTGWLKPEPPAGPPTGPPCPCRGSWCACR